MSDAIITTQTDFEVGTFVPTEAADTASHPGALEIAAGQTTLAATYHGEHPTYVAGGWGKLLLIGTAPGASSIRGRVRLAATEGGLAAAAWSRYSDIWTYYIDPATGEPRDDGMGVAVFDVGSAILNEDLSEAGPWYEIQVLMRTD